MNIKQTFIIMNMNFIQTSAVALVAMALVSCQETDTEAPTACTGLGATNSVTAEEIEAEAGDHVDLEDIFCDNEALSEVRWDIHNGEGHAHEDEEDGEEEEHEHGLVLHSGTDWAVLETQALSGTEAEVDLHVDVPLTARGVWHVIVSLVDEAGNSTTLATELHVENDHLPEFTLTEVGGEDPAMWHGEPTWAAGTDVVVTGTVADSDGVATAVLELISEDTESVVWEVALEPAGATNFEFSETVTVPSDGGEHHFEMKATDANGVEMETGFHVEVE